MKRNMLNTCIFARTRSGVKEISENRLVQINYPGTGNYSQFTYDGYGQFAGIIEVSGGSTSSTKAYIWVDDRLCEARNTTGAILSQYFVNGQTSSGTGYFYTRDQLGSVREMTNATGTLEAEYSYDPFGRTQKLTGPLQSDFQYVVGCYVHAASGLNLAQTRMYNSASGRWLSRDFMGEDGGVNLYCYVENDPISNIDPSGLIRIFNPIAPAPGGFKNCYMGDKSCCGYNNNKCHDRCPPCTPYREALKRVGDPEWPFIPTTPGCHRCCSGLNYTCRNGPRQVDLGIVQISFGINGASFFACAESGMQSSK